jgi:hypothetical protein
VPAILMLWWQGAVGTLIAIIQRNDIPGGVKELSRIKRVFILVTCS